MSIEYLTDVRVLRATCNESEGGFRVHLTDEDWDDLVKNARLLREALVAEREHSANLQRGFDDPDGGPLARALARSLYHLEQQERRKVEDVRDALAREVRALRAERDEARAEVERLRGIAPDAPPRPPDGEGLPRYGVRWNGPTEPLAVPMDDGYWTPWHLAMAALAKAHREGAEVMREECALTFDCGSYDCGCEKMEIANKIRQALLPLPSGANGK